jgi:hypothetical protein
MSVKELLFYVKGGEGESHPGACSVFANSSLLVPINELMVFDK